MPTIKLRFGAGETPVTIPGGDLRSLLTPANATTIFQISDSEIVDSKGHRFDQLPTSTSSLTAGLTVGSDAKWKLGGAGGVDLAFKFSASTEGVVAIKRAGEIFRYTRGRDEKDQVVVSVPDGFAYVVVKLKVSLEVGGQAGFSHGAFGVKANVDSSLKFDICNYRCFPVSTNVEEAIKASFETFLFPFKVEGIDGLNSGDFIEYEFIGKLGLGFGINYGISGLFLGGRSAGEIKRSFESKAGSAVIKAKPSFKFGAEFAVSYDHEDAFHVVVGRQKEATRGVNSVSLFLFKMDQSKLSTKFTAGLSVSAGASFDVSLKLDEAIDDAAKKLFAGLPEGPIRDEAVKAFKENLKKEEHKRELEKYVKDANEKVAKLLKKLDNKKIELQVLNERISTQTVLFDYEFDLAADQAALTSGYALAVSGNFVAATKVSGVALRAGSCVEEEFISRTTIALHLFDLFHLADVTTYFRKTTIVYTGDGVFRLRFTTGVTHETGHVGHARHVEVFFTADVLTKDFLSVADLDVNLHFVLIDNANAKAARQTAGVLAAIGSGSDLQIHASRIKQLVDVDKSLTIKATAVFHREAYGRLTADEFVSGKPQPLPHPLDDANWEAFVRANNFILAGEGFKGQGFPNLFEPFNQWILYNRTAIDEETSTKPPNRRIRGNINTDSRWPSQLIDVSHDDRRFMFIYLDAGRRFMNLCENLRHLGLDLDDTTTEERYRDLLDTLNFMIQEGIKVWFTKPILLALFRLMGGRVANLKGPSLEETIAKEYEVSFDVTA